MGPGSTAEELLDLAHSMARRSGYPEAARLKELANAAIDSLKTESLKLRPPSSIGEPGGLVRVETPFAIVVPDLHARSSLLADLLASTPPPSSSFSPDVRVIDLVLDGGLTIVCLGDILNSEGRIGAERWHGAALRLIESPRPKSLLSEEMDEEMGASIGALGLVMALKARLGQSFHCLKGNHDNITNSSMNGDSAFYKFAMEGAMGAEWFRLRYGEKLAKVLRRYERLLPLVAVGRTFCASHAEPAFPVGAADLLEYRARADIVSALIWTGNDQAESGAVRKSLAALLGFSDREEGGTWISGHRPVEGYFAARDGGRLIQIHNPERQQVAWIDDRPGDKPGEVAGRITLHEIRKGGGAMRLLAAVPAFRLDHPMPRD